MRKFLLIIASVLMLSAYTEAQVVVNSDYDKELFKSRVKLVEGFMRRFNLTEILHTIDTTQADYMQKNILSLFDAQLFGTKGEKDSLFKEAQSFAKDVLKTGTKLHYEDTTWFAIAPCHGKFKGKPVDFVLMLNVEEYAEDSYKWVIANAEGDIFKLTPSSTGNDILITPLAHETNFMELGRITTQKDDWILNYSQKQYELDPTAVFFAYVNAGLLDIEYVKNLQFMFLQLPGWKFTIMDFDRQTMNAGWLITSFEKMNNQDKKKLLENVYHKK